MINLPSVSIGWIIFWKCVVVGVWAGIVARWQSYRKERHQRGLELKPNRQGVYVASDWTRYVDLSALWLKRGIMAFGFLWWTVLSLGFLFGGKEGATLVVNTVFDWLVY